MQKKVQEIQKKYDVYRKKGQVSEVDYAAIVIGGMRASIYNAMPLEGVQALVDFMQEFEKNYA